MKYVFTALSLFLFAFPTHAEEPASAQSDEKVIAVGKKISASPEVLTLFFREIEKKDPSPDQVVKSQEFLQRNPLPPRQLFQERKETIGNFFQEVIGREPTRGEVRKTMEFLIEQEALANARRQEEAAEKENTPKPNETESSPNPSQPQNAQNSNPENALSKNDLGFNPLTGTLGVGPGSERIVAADPTGGDEPGGFSSRPAHGSAPAPAADVESTEKSETSLADSGPAVLGPTEAPVNPALIPFAAPIITEKTIPSLKETLEEALGEKIKSGEITAPEGKQILDEMISEVVPSQTPTPVPESGLEMTQLVAPSPKVSIPDSLPTLQAGALNPSDSKASPLAQETVREIVIQGANPTPTPTPMDFFAKKEMKPAEGASGQETEKSSDSSELIVTAGMGNGGEVTTRSESDNSGSTPVLRAKSGGTLELAPQAKQKVGAWLNGYVERFLARKKLQDNDTLMIGSAGLPSGSLETSETNEPTDWSLGDRELTKNAQPIEAPIDSQDSPYAYAFLATLIAGLGWRWMRKHRKPALDEESRVEPKWG